MVGWGRVTKRKGDEDGEGYDGRVWWMGVVPRYVVVLDFMTLVDGGVVQLVIEWKNHVLRRFPDSLLYVVVCCFQSVLHEV